MTIFETVRETIAQELGVSPDEVTPEVPLRSLVTDSLEMASLVLELEGRLGVEIPDEDICGLRLVSDVVNYAEAH